MCIAILHNAVRWSEPKLFAPRGVSSYTWVAHSSSYRRWQTYDSVCTTSSEIQLSTTSFSTTYTCTATSCVAHRYYNRWQTYHKWAVTHIPHILDWRPTWPISIFRIVGLPQKGVGRGGVSRNLINAGNLAQTVFMNIISLHNAFLFRSNQDIFSGWVGLTTMKHSMGFTSIIQQHKQCPLAVWGTMGGGAPVHSPMEKLSPISSHFGPTIGGGGMLHIQAPRRAFADVITL